MGIEWDFLMTMGYEWKTSQRPEIVTADTQSKNAEIFIGKFIVRNFKTGKSGQGLIGHSLIMHFVPTGFVYIWITWVNYLYTTKRSHYEIIPCEGNGSCCQLIKNRIF